MAVVFETERLRVRHYTLADVEAAFAIYSDPEVTRFLLGPEESLETQRAGIERIIARYSTLNGMGFWAIEEKSSGALVGSALLKPLPGWPEIEVGWHLARGKGGNGYATEAGRDCLEYGFGTLGLKRIDAVVNPENERSLAVARRLGMRHEGRIRAYEEELELFASGEEARAVEEERDRGAGKELSA